MRNSTNGLTNTDSMQLLVYVLGCCDKLLLEVIAAFPYSFNFIAFQASIKIVL